MKLLNEIVDALINEGGSLTEALLKTKVLLHRIGQPELVSWVDSELKGYSLGDSVPEYRQLRGSVVGTITNGYYVYSNHQIPLRQLTEEQRDKLEHTVERHSIGVIEKMLVGVEKGNTYSIPIEPEICAALSAVLQDGYFIQHASTYFQPSQFRQVLIEVRSRLLSFVLKLQDELGESVSDNEVKTAAAKIDVPSMFAGAVIGDNAVFQIMGENNHQRVSNRNVKGNRQALADELRKHGVSDDDIQTLEAAVVADPVPTTENQYGPGVRGWMSRMLGKAVDGSWNIGISVAGTVLASALQRYYGLPG